MLSWPTLFRNPSCACPDAHLPQALSPLPPSLRLPFLHAPWTPAVSSLRAACLPRDKASPLTRRCWPPAGPRAVAGGQFPGWGGSGTSHPPVAAWDPRSPPTEGWEWPEMWRTAGPKGSPHAPRPRCRHGYRLRAVSPEQPGGGRQGQSDMRQERWSWKRGGGKIWEVVEWQRSYLKKCMVHRRPGQPQQLRHWLPAKPAITQNDILCICTPYVPPTPPTTIHLTISPSLRCVHWDPAPPIISLCKIKQRGKRRRGRRRVQLFSFFYALRYKACKHGHQQIVPAERQVSHLLKKKATTLPRATEFKAHLCA